MEPGGAGEVSIPESARSIDLVTFVGEAKDVWGILREDLSRRRVAFEHYSRPPDRGDLAKCFLELAWVLEQWWRKREGGRPPLGLVISVGRPRAALGFYPLLRPWEPAGVYRTCAPLGDHGLELILVDVKNLVPARGTEFLRMFDHRAGAGNLRALLEAPEVGRLSKKAIGALVKNKKQLFEPEEWDIMKMFDDKLEEGRMLGIRSSLILQLESRFGPLKAADRARIEAASERQLQAWTLSVFGARSVKGVLDRGSRARRGSRSR